jgi:hypothetical protein
MEGYQAPGLPVQNGSALKFSDSREPGGTLMTVAPLASQG